MRHGIIDVGSNAIRMRVVDADATRVEKITKARIAVRLGSCVFATGAISPELQDATIEGFREFLTTCEEHGVERVTAVATSATREANNHDVLVARLRDELGVELKVISGETEAQLIARAMTSRIDTRTGTSVWIDLGGGSVEVIASQGSTLTSASYHLGALRILKEIDDGAPTFGPEFVARLHAYVQTFAPQISAQLPEYPATRFAAAGGSLERLEKLLRKAGASAARDGVRVLQLSTLQEWEQRLAALPYAERAERYSLPKDRADTIVPAAAVTYCIGEIIGANEVLVPRVGLIDGLIEELRS